MAIREFRESDDLALREVFHDAGDPAGLVVRGLFRADEEDPVLRCVVATLDDDPESAGILIGAAALAESPAHPGRAWAHVEVAAAERRLGHGRALLAAVREAAAGTAIAGLPLRARVSAGSTGEAAATAVGFAPLFTTRVVRVSAGALGSLGADRLEDFEVTATGSVALTRAFAGWYAGVNRADPAAGMTLGQVNTRFLSEAAGAHGAALMRRDGEVSAFAVSFARDDGAGAAGGAGVAGGPGAGGVAGMEHVPGTDDAGPEATELTLGSVLDGSGDGVDRESPEFQAALGDAGALLARLSVDTPVALEVTSEMPVMSTLVDGLLAAGQAQVLQEYVTLGAD